MHLQDGLRYSEKSGTLMSVCAHLITQKEVRIPVGGVVFLCETRREFKELVAKSSPVLDALFISSSFDVYFSTEILNKFFILRLVATNEGNDNTFGSFQLLTFADSIARVLRSSMIRVGSNLT